MTNCLRVLAVDPSPRGFGYAVLEGRSSLVDWGLVHVRGNKNAESIRRLADFVKLYRPEALALEDCAAAGCRRRTRARVLIADMATYAEMEGLIVRSVSWRMIRLAVAGDSRATKEACARAVVERLPELEDYLPPHRKPWMSEDPRMSLFDAVGIAFTCVQATSSAARKRTSPN